MPKNIGAEYFEKTLSVCVGHLTEGLSKALIESDIDGIVYQNEDIRITYPYLDGTPSSVAAWFSQLADCHEDSKYLMTILAYAFHENCATVAFMGGGCIDPVSEFPHFDW